MRPPLRDLLNFLGRRLEGGALVVYGEAGSLRTRIALLLCAEHRPALYIGAGRHSRVGRGPEGVTIYPTRSFYEELLKVTEVVGLCRAGAMRLVAIDEFLANLVPYRASLSEAYIGRMALAEVELLGMARDGGCKVVLVCAEDRRRGAPLALRVIRQLKPRLVRVEAEEGVLVAEERELGDPSVSLGRYEAPLDDVVSVISEALGYA